MPKNLIDVSTFTDPIVVPTGGDARTALSVETAFQGLSNRTKYLDDFRVSADSRLTAVEADTVSSYNINVTGGVAGLRALDPASVASSGTIVRAYIDRHTSSGDGGQGQFVRVEGSAGAYVDDNCTTIVPSGGDGSDAWQRIDISTVTPEMAGGSVAIAAGVAATTGIPLDLGGPENTWVLPATVSISSNITIIGSGATLDISGLGGSDTGISISGSVADTSLLSSNASAGDTQISVISTSGFTAGEWIRVSSTEIWGLTSTMSEYVRIASIDSGTLMTLSSALLYDYTLAYSARVTRYNYLDKVKVSGFRIIGTGAADTQGGVVLQYTKDSVVKNITTYDIGYTGVQISRSINFSVSDCNFNRAITPGYSYGVSVVHGSSFGNITNILGSDTRHVVTIGGDDGTCRSIFVSDCIARHSRDSGVDCHPGSDYITFDNIKVHCDVTGTDGITVQGGHITLENIEVHGCNRHAVLIQPILTHPSHVYVDNVYGVAVDRVINISPLNCSLSSVHVSNIKGSAGSYFVDLVASVGETISNVSISNIHMYESTSTAAVRLYSSGGDFNSVTIDHVTCDVTGTGYGVYVLSTASGVFESVSVANSVITTENDAIRYYANGGDINSVRTSGCDITMTVPSTGHGVYMISAASGSINGVFASENNIHDGAVSIRANGDVTNMVISEDNILTGATTAPVLGIDSTHKVGLFLGDLSLAVIEQDAGIVSDSITLAGPSVRIVTLDTEGLAAGDNLQTIVSTYAYVGQEITLRTNSDSRDVSVITGGNIHITSTVLLDLTSESLTLIYDGTNWIRR